MCDTDCVCVVAAPQVDEQDGSAVTHVSRVRLCRVVCLWTGWWLAKARAARQAAVSEHHGAQVACPRDTSVSVTMLPVFDAFPLFGREG